MTTEPNTRNINQILQLEHSQPFKQNLTNIASVIAAAQPDIAVFVEIEMRTPSWPCRSAEINKNRPFAYYACGDKPNRTITMP